MQVENMAEERKAFSAGCVFVLLGEAVFLSETRQLEKNSSRAKNYNSF